MIFDVFDVSYTKTSDVYVLVLLPLLRWVSSRRGRRNRLLGHYPRSDPVGSGVWDLRVVPVSFSDYRY